MTKFVDVTAFCIWPSQIPYAMYQEDVHGLVTNWPELGSCELAFQEVPRVCLSGSLSCNCLRFCSKYFSSV